MMHNSMQSDYSDDNSCLSASALAMASAQMAPFKPFGALKNKSSESPNFTLTPICIADDTRNNSKKERVSSPSTFHPTNIEPVTDVPTVYRDSHIFKYEVNNSKFDRAFAELAFVKMDKKRFTSVTYFDEAGNPTGDSDSQDPALYGLGMASDETMRKVKEAEAAARKSKEKYNSFYGAKLPAKSSANRLRSRIIKNGKQAKGGGTNKLANPYVHIPWTGSERGDRKRDRKSDGKHASETAIPTTETGVCSCKSDDLPPPSYDVTVRCTGYERGKVKPADAPLLSVLSSFRIDESSLPDLRFLVGGAPVAIGVGYLDRGIGEFVPCGLKLEILHGGGLCGGAGGEPSSATDPTPPAGTLDGEEPLEEETLKVSSMHSFSWRIRRPLRGQSKPCKTDSAEKSETVVLERSGVTSDCAQARADDDGVAELSNPAKLAGSSVTVETSAQLEKTLRDALTKLDDRLLEVLSEGAIRLVRSSWLLQQPAGFHLPCRQQLELLEGALLSAEEAVALVMRGNRSIAVLSHGWLSPGDPDPKGERVATVCRALRDHQSFAAIFWDYASLYQHPPGGRRTEEEDAAFSCALDVMGDLYASAVGTTVLQIKQIPPRPAEFDGKLCLQGLAAGCGKKAICAELRRFGTVRSCEMGGPTDAVVRFSTHEMAVAAAKGAPSLGLCGAAFTLYNERSYDGRRGEDGRDDDDGRGWCCFESAVSSEILARLSAYPSMRAALEALPPKLVTLTGDGYERKETEVRALDNRVDHVLERIDAATFTGSADKHRVPLLYKEFVTRIANTLQGTLGCLELAPLERNLSMGNSLPQLSMVTVPPLRLVAHQILLLPESASGGGACARFAIVDGSGQLQLRALAAVERTHSAEAGARERLREAEAEASRKIALLKRKLKRELSEAEEDEIALLKRELSRELSEAEAEAEAARGAADGVSDLPLDSCSHVVIPWLPAAKERWGEALIRDERTVLCLQGFLHEASNLLEAAKKEIAGLAYLSKGNVVMTKEVGAKKLMEAKTNRSRLLQTRFSEMHAEAQQIVSEMKPIATLPPDLFEAAAAKPIMRACVDDAVSALALCLNIEMDGLDDRLKMLNAVAARFGREGDAAALVIAIDEHAASLERAIKELRDRRVELLSAVTGSSDPKPSEATERPEEKRARLALEKETRQKLSDELTRQQLSDELKDRLAKLPQLAEPLTSEMKPLAVVFEAEKAAAVVFGERIKDAQAAILNASAAKEALEQQERDKSQRRDLEEKQKRNAQATTFEKQRRGEGENANSLLQDNDLGVKLRDDNMEPKIVRDAKKAFAALDTVLDAVLDAADSLRPERIIQACGMLGMRRYALGQSLCVRHERCWCDAVVAETPMSSKHRLWIDSRDCTIDLHPWNHAPRELPVADFDVMREWWLSSLRSQHSHIADAVSGRLLDTLQQCVSITVAGSSAIPREQQPPSGINDVHALSKWLLSLHSSHCGGGLISTPSAVLLTGSPASGKTTLVSQAVMLACESHELVPILVKVQRIEAQMRQAPNAFSSAWNWVDASVALEYGDGSPLHRMLRQAMKSRRALLLLDGLDEGGVNRDAIENHVTAVLAPQGHLMLATSRPAGINHVRFRDFTLVELAPLSQSQQNEALEGRLGTQQMPRILPYLEQMPLDRETGQRVTSNPLMLAMVASVFELRQGVDMPATVAELYDIASEAMLARGSATSDALRRMLEAVVCEAHVAGRRVIEDQHLLNVALDLQSSAGGPSSEERLSEESASVLSEMRNRVSRDELPLLRLLQARPLELQSSHLSFQEFFTARALCDKNRRSMGLRPWEWTAWWANVLAFGEEMGEGFARGLLQASDVEGEVLDLKLKLYLGRGHRPTALRVVTVLMSALTNLSLRHNTIRQSCAAVLGKALAVNRFLINLDLSYNELGNVGAAAIADALRVNSTLEHLGLRHNRIGDEGGTAIAKALEVNCRLTVLNLSSNSVGVAGATDLADALRRNSVLIRLSLDSVGDRGAAVFTSAVQDNPVPGARLVELGALELRPSGGLRIRLGAHNT